VELNAFRASSSINLLNVAISSAEESLFGVIASISTLSA